MSGIVQLVLATTRGIITQTFASGTSSWTAPAGVTKILTASGRGANGTTDVWGAGTDQAVAYSLVANATGTNGAVETWESISAAAAPASSGSNGANLRWNTYPNGNTQLIAPFAGYVTWRGGVTRYTVGSPGTGNIVNGSFGTASAPSYPFGINVPPDSYAGYYWLAAEILISSGGAGANSTIGSIITFPGGAYGTSATTSNFTNIAVTPGTTYTITNNGSIPITITY